MHCGICKMGLLVHDAWGIRSFRTFSDISVDDFIRSLASSHPYTPTYMRVAGIVKIPLAPFTNMV